MLVPILLPVLPKGEGYKQKNNSENPSSDMMELENKLQRYALKSLSVLNHYALKPIENDRILQTNL